MLISEETRELPGLFVVAKEASMIINSILLLLEENFDDKVISRLTLFTDVYFVTRIIRNYFKEFDLQAINEYYEPFYQIKVDEHKKIVGAESLARFKQGDKYVSQEKYINNFEANGLMLYLDLKAIEEGIKLIKELESNNLIDSTFKLSINLSSLTIEMLEYEKIINLFNEYKCNNITRIIEVVVVLYNVKFF